MDRSCVSARPKHRRKLLDSAIAKLEETDSKHSYGGMRTNTQAAGLCFRPAAISIYVIAMNEKLLAALSSDESHAGDETSRKSQHRARLGCKVVLSSRRP